MIRLAVGRTIQLQQRSVMIDYLADCTQWLGVLAQWHHDEWSRYNPGDTIEKRIERMQAHLEKRQIPTTFVAHNGDEPFGSACLVSDDTHGLVDLSPWLASVFVAPLYRKLGIASRLVKRVIEEARTLNVPTLYLYTPDRESFYLPLGFKTIDRRQYHGDEIVIMSQTL